MTVFVGQEMDDAGFTPDGECFSILLEGMVLTKDTSTLGHMLDHIKVCVCLCIN